MVLDYIQHLISFGGLSILKKYRAHSYRRSSVVLICGLLSTQCVMQSWSVTILLQMLLHTVGARMHFAKQFTRRFN